MDERCFILPMYPSMEAPSVAQPGRREVFSPSLLALCHSPRVSHDQIAKLTPSL